MLQLLHPVEGGACLEPFDLCLVEGVVQYDGLLAAVAVLYECAQRLQRERVRRREKEREEEKKFMLDTFIFN